MKAKKIRKARRKVHRSEPASRTTLPAMDGQTIATTGPKPRRIRPALARALDLIAINGNTQRDAARRAGMNEAALSKALAKPHVAHALEQRKALAALEADQLKGIARSMAIREGIRLMTEASSEQVRAKMVEFFAGEARQPAVSVQINNAPASGYIYARPDTPSGAGSKQVIEGKAKDVTPE